MSSSLGIGKALLINPQYKHLTEIHMKNIMLLVSAMFLFGCSSSVEELVRSGDWYQVGYHDGVTGHSSRSIKELNALGQANSGDYDRGYLQGVNEYCNPNFAYQIGLSGNYYEGVCESLPDGQKFRMEWQRGWNEYSR